MSKGHAVRVAAVTTAAIALVYVACVTVANLIVSAHLTAQADARLGDRLTDLRRNPAAVARQLSHPSTDDDDDDDGDSSPIIGWLLGPDRRALASTPGAPALPTTLTSAPTGQTVTMSLGTAGPYRLNLAQNGTDALALGLSLSGDRRIEHWPLRACLAGTSRRNQRYLKHYEAVCGESYGVACSRDGRAGTSVI